MKPKKILYGLIALLTLTSLFALTGTDDDPIKKIVTQLNRWTDSIPQEKVYLHMDKSYYASGEDIWFKAYVTIGVDHQLSAASRVLNVELINDRDSVKQAIKLPVNNGVAFGDFALPDTLRAGSYRIRAYTNYMRNAGEDYFFDRTFSIGNAISNNIYTDASYKYSTVNGQQHVDADITFTDLNGVAYVGKEVSYEVQLDARNVARGKGITDSKGILHIGFNNTMPTLQKSGRIVTNLKYDPKKTYTQSVPIKAASGKISVQFFPEGGNLVSGMRSRVAFKAIGADGLGVNITGVVKDNNGTETAQLKAAHLGMGAFTITPMKGSTYQAEVTLPDGSKDKFDLPVAMPNGYVMTVTNAGDNLALRVVTNNADPEVINVVAQQNGKVYYAARSSAGSATFSSIIPKSRFPEGIVQFTLFSATAEPIAERLVFVHNPASLLDIDVKTDKQTYAQRGKVKLDIGAASGGKAVLSSLSAVVIDESKAPVDENKENTILSSLLLTSDLKGYIEQPGYYFNKESDKTQSDLDLLMMTQGYRRFVWKQILNNNFPPVIYKPERFLSVSGTVTQGKKPVPRAKVTIMSNKGGVFILDTLADEQGHFAFNNLVFKDSVRFVVQARTEKGRKFVDIDLDNISSPLVNRNPNAPDVQISVSDTLSRYLKTSHDKYLGEVKYGVGNHITMLKEVVIKENVKKNDVPNSTNLNGPGNADQVIKGDALGTCPTLELCLQGRANFVVFRNGIAYSTRSLNTPMAIVLDGMTMGPDFTLDDIPATDVESVEVLRTAAYTSIYGMNGGGGVLVITTKRGGGNTSYIKYSPGVITYAPKGYYMAREFYSPDYENNKTNPAMPDLRTTIYWKPNIVTDNDGHVSLTYFNADGKGTYRVVVEGIDGEGHLGRKVYRYKVE